MFPRISLSAKFLHLKCHEFNNKNRACNHKKILEKNEKKVVGIEFLSSYRNDTTYGGEQARGRIDHGAWANQPGDEQAS